MICRDHKKCVCSRFKLVGAYSMSHKVVIITFEKYYSDTRKRSQSKQEGVAIKEGAAAFRSPSGSPELWSISRGADCSPVGQTTGKAALLSSSSTLS